MKYLLVLLLLAGCSSIPEPMDQSRVNEYKQEMVQLSGRVLITSPKIYVIPRWSDFQRKTCGHSCGVGMATAIYVPTENEVLVNTEIIKPDQFDGVIVHELVHAAQHEQRDKRPCVDQEYEAYKAQFKAMKWRVNTAIYYDFAIQSCMLSGRM